MDSGGSAQSTTHVLGAVAPAARQRLITAIRLVADWYARDPQDARSMKASLSGGLASLGAGTPTPVAGKMALPVALLSCVMGDGGIQMNGLNVMITILKYCRRVRRIRACIVPLPQTTVTSIR